MQVLDSISPKLTKYLESRDFFEVDEFPTAKFEMSGSKIIVTVENKI